MPIKPLSRSNHAPCGELTSCSARLARLASRIVLPLTSCEQDGEARTERAHGCMRWASGTIRAECPLTHPNSTIRGERALPFACLVVGFSELNASGPAHRCHPCGEQHAHRLVRLVARHRRAGTCGPGSRRVTGGLAVRELAEGREENWPGRRRASMGMGPSAHLALVAVMSRMPASSTTAVHLHMVQHQRGGHDLAVAGMICHSLPQHGHAPRSPSKVARPARSTAERRTAGGRQAARLCLE